METTKQTSKEYFKTLSILHLALTIGLISIGLVGFYLIISGIMSNNMTELNMIFYYVNSILILVGLFGSNWIYKNKLNGLKGENVLKTKMTNYRGVLIFRYAFLEGPAFFAFVSALLTGNLLFLAFTGLVIIFMIYWRPTISSVIADLELNQQEISIIENPDSIIAEITNTRRY